MPSRRPPGSSDLNTALHFGAEKIGRGFLAQFYCEAGLHTVFVDIRDELIERLNQQDHYPIRFMNPTGDEVRITNFSALHAGNNEAVAKAFAEAAFVSTAVGERALPAVARSLAPGISLRRANGGGPVDVLVCENMTEAAAFLAQETRKHLDAGDAAWMDAHVGFVDAIIGRMVPETDAAALADEPLLVTAEPYPNIYLDAEAFKAPPLDHPKFFAVEQYEAYDARKLMMHNMGHAAAAYLGYQGGYRFVHEAIADASVRACVEGAMRETALALHRKYGLDLEECEEHGAELVERFANPLLHDTITRVAGDPVRKLGPRDRLIGAARLCEAQNVPPDCVAVACAAALAYDHGGDPMAVHLQELIAGKGAEAVLHEVCGIAPGEALGTRILEAYQRER